MLVQVREEWSIQLNGFHLIPRQTSTTCLVCEASIAKGGLINSHPDLVVVLYMFMSFFVSTNTMSGWNLISVGLTCPQDLLA